MIPNIFSGPKMDISGELDRINNISRNLVLCGNGHDIRDEPEPNSVQDIKRKGKLSFLHFF